MDKSSRGVRKGQLRYYLRTFNNPRKGLRWNRFWSARWFWSAGRLGPIPDMYHEDYWKKS